MKIPTRRREEGVEMAIKEKDLRVPIFSHCRALNASGLNLGTAGNISARLGDKMLITPSAVPYASMRPEMIAAMPLAGEKGARAGAVKPCTHGARPLRH